MIFFPPDHYFQIGSIFLVCVSVVLPFSYGMLIIATKICNTSLSVLLGLYVVIFLGALYSYSSSTIGCASFTSSSSESSLYRFEKQERLGERVLYREMIGKTQDRV